MTYSFFMNTTTFFFLRNFSNKIGMDDALWPVLSNIAKLNQLKSTVPIFCELHFVLSYMCYFSGQNNDFIYSSKETKNFVIF